jgi:hypothetical protein
MRKSFKVATVFTGTAAVAATAAVFAPAADASPLANEVIHYNCPLGTYTRAATVLRWPASKHHGPTCVSAELTVPGNGKTNLGNTYFSYFCAANYSGNILYTNGGHRHYSPGDGTGTIKTEVKSVALSGWFGNLGYSCYVS